MWIGDGYLNIFRDTLGRQDRPLYQPDPTRMPRMILSTLEFRHNAYDDPQYTIGAGRVAFNLSSLAGYQRRDGRSCRELLDFRRGNRLIN